jgi:uncharacterized RDD family membrane protein YckC
VEEIVTGEAVILDLPVARFPTRMLARIIDMVVQLTLFVIISLVDAASTVDSAVAAAILITGLVLTVVGYPVALETLSRGRTLGKLALGLRVVADDGGPVRFRQALVRALAGVIECWGLLGVPALITSMLSARGKRLGDIFAGTFVVRVRAPRPVASGYQASPYGAGGYLAGGYAAGVGPTGMPVEPALRPWASTLDLSGLPEPLAASASSYLSRYWQLDTRVRDRLGWQLASDIATRVSPPPPPGLPPVPYLNAVLAQRRDRELARLWATSPPPAVTPPAVHPPVAYPPVAYPPVTRPPVARPPVADPPAVTPSAAGVPSPAVGTAPPPPVSAAPVPASAASSSEALPPASAAEQPPPAAPSAATGGSWPAPASPPPDSGGFAPPA